MTGWKGEGVRECTVAVGPPGSSPYIIEHLHQCEKVVLPYLFYSRVLGQTLAYHWQTQYARYAVVCVTLGVSFTGQTEQGGKDCRGAIIGLRVEGVSGAVEL